MRFDENGKGFGKRRTQSHTKFPQRRIKAPDREVGGGHVGNGEVGRHIEDHLSQFPLSEPYLRIVPAFDYARPRNIKLGELSVVNGFLVARIAAARLPANPCVVDWCEHECKNRVGG